MKRIAVFGYYGFGNTGDDAVLQSILDDLSDLNRELEITVFSNNPQLTEAQYAQYQIHAASWDDQEGMIDVIRQIDLLIIGGGGLYNCYLDYPGEFFLKGNHRYFSVVTFGLPFLAQRCGTPCMVCGVGASEIWSEEAKEHIGTGLAKCDVVTVRDEGSKNILQSLPGAENVEIVVTGDPVFRLNHHRVDLKDMTSLFDEVCCLPEPLVGISLRNWDFAGDKERTLAAVTGALNRFYKKYGGSLLLLPFDNGSVLEKLSEDELIFEELLKRLDAGITYKKLNGYLLPYQASKLIEMCDMTLCMRLHPIVMSIKSEVPVIGIVYDQKVRNVMEMCRMDEWTISLETITEGGLYSLMHELYEDRDAVTAEWKDVHVKMRRAAKENIRYVQKFMDKRICIDNSRWG